MSIEEYTVIISINLMVTGLSLMSPYYINQIIDYIENKDREIDPPSQSRGFFFLGLMVVSQAIFYLVSEHLDYT